MSSSDQKTRYLLLLIFFVAFIARASRVYTGSHIDEGENFVAVIRIIGGQTVYRDVGLNRPLFMVWLMTPVVSFFKGHLSALFVLRIISGLATASICFPVYGLGRFFSNKEVGLWAALFYALEPFSIYFNTFIHPTNFYVVFAVWAVYLFNRGLHQKSVLLGALSGLCGGLAVVVKHSGLIVLAYFLVFFVFFKKNKKNENKFFLKLSVTTLVLFSLPIISFLIYCWVSDIFREMVWHLWNFNILESTNVFYTKTVFEKIVGSAVVSISNPVFVILGIPSIPLVLKNTRQRVLLAWMATSYFVAIWILTCAWNHYFLELYPPASILCAIFFVYYKKTYFSKIRKLDWFLSVSAIAILIVQAYIMVDAHTASYTVFDEVEVGSSIKDRINSNNTILVLSNPIYYTWINNSYPRELDSHYWARYSHQNTAFFMAGDDMKQKIAVLENNPPDFILIEKYWWHKMTEPNDALEKYSASIFSEFMEEEYEFLEEFCPYNKTFEHVYFEEDKFDCELLFKKNGYED